MLHYLIEEVDEVVNDSTYHIRFIRYKLQITE